MTTPTYHARSVYGLRPGSVPMRVERLNPSLFAVVYRNTNAIIETFDSERAAWSYIATRLDHEREVARRDANG